MTTSFLILIFSRRRRVYFELCIRKLVDLIGCYFYFLRWCLSKTKMKKKIQWIHHKRDVSSLTGHTRSLKAWKPDVNYRDDVKNSNERKPENVAEKLLKREKSTSATVSCQLRLMCGERIIIIIIISPWQGHGSLYECLLSTREFPYD